LAGHPKHAHTALDLVANVGGLDRELTYAVAELFLVSTYRQRYSYLVLVLPDGAKIEGGVATSGHPSCNQRNRSFDGTDTTHAAVGCPSTAMNAFAGHTGAVP
jgi:hypothetical protein